jgi:phosphohistidine phosphatase
VNAVFFLVRHAEAERPEGVTDRDRTLTAAGRAGFARLAGSLAPSLEVVRILSSPFARARETALILSAATGAGVEESESLASGRSTGPELLRLARDSGGGTAVVGHSPEIAEAIVLAAGSSQGVPPGTIAAVEEALGTYRLVWVRRP